MLKKLSYFLIISLLLFSCSDEPTDEELKDNIHGTWVSSLIVADNGMNFTPEKDSSLFFSNGNRLVVNFHSHGMTQTQNGSEVLPYEINDGILSIQFTEDTTVINHTIYQKIEYLDRKKLVVQYNGAKIYYDKFVY